MTTLWREPLVHFAVLGGLLFAGNAVWQKASDKADYTISVSTAELERQAVIFAGENRRQPTDEDLRALLFAYVEEQALMREAQRLGLGEDDTIIRRRLAQKMRFMIEDVDAPAQPSDKTLKDWFENNKDKFVIPERRAFTHIYLSPESRGAAINADAQSLLARVNDENWESLGDPFMMKRDFELLDGANIERMFGKNFAKSLFGFEGNMWQGPVSSAFGLHIVRVNKIEAETMPSFEQARAKTANLWSEQTQREQNSARLKTLISKYKVDIEGAE